MLKKIATLIAILIIVTTTGCDLDFLHGKVHINLATPASEGEWTAVPCPPWANDLGQWCYTHEPLSVLPGSWEDPLVIPVSSWMLTVIQLNDAFISYSEGIRWETPPEEMIDGNFYRGFLESDSAFFEIVERNDLCLNLDGPQTMVPQEMNVSREGTCSIP